MELENKLTAYRTKKKREERIQHIKETVKNFFSRKRSSNIVEVSKQQELQEQEEPLIDSEISKLPIIPEKLKESAVAETVVKSERSRIITLFCYGSGFLFWGYLWSIFITQGFGTVFLIISALFGIYFNTRTGPRDENEVSAYSVFNKNCESIDGTLKAEQFEREIRFGALSVH